MRHSRFTSAVQMLHVLRDRCTLANLAAAQDGVSGICDYPNGLAHYISRSTRQFIDWELGLNLQWVAPGSLEVHLSTHYVRYCVRYWKLSKKIPG